MQILALFALVAVVIWVAMWIIFYPFRMRAEDKLIVRILNDPDIQDAMLSAMARAQARRKKKAQIDRLVNPVSKTPPKGRIPRLLWEVDKEAERLKRQALDEIYSEID